MENINVLGNVGVRVVETGEISVGSVGLSHVDHSPGAPALRDAAVRRKCNVNPGSAT